MHQSFSGTEIKVQSVQAQPLSEHHKMTRKRVCMAPRVHTCKWASLTRTRLKMIFAAKRERTADQHAHMAGAHTFYLSLYTLLYVFFVFFVHTCKLTLKHHRIRNQKPLELKCRYTNSWQTRQLQNWPLREGREVVISSKTKYVTFCFLYWSILCINTTYWLLFFHGCMIVVLFLSMQIQAEF